MAVSPSPSLDALRAEIRAIYPMTRQSNAPIQYYAQPDFDRAENWTVGVDIKLADGTVEHLLTQTLATPPGIGPWGVLLFLIPILLFGSLAALVFLRRSRRRRARSRRAPVVTKIEKPSALPSDAPPPNQP